MQDFGVGTVAKSRTKHGGVITVNVEALANRTFKIPGRGPAPLGCPFRAQNKWSQLFVSQEEDHIAMSDKDLRQPITKFINFFLLLNSFHTFDNALLRK